MKDSKTRTFNNKIRRIYNLQYVANDIKMKKKEEKARARSVISKKQKEMDLKMNQLINSGKSIEETEKIIEELFPDLASNLKSHKLQLSNGTEIDKLRAQLLYKAGRREQGMILADEEGR